MLEKLQPMVELALNGAEQVIEISVPVGVLSSTVGVTVTVAELIRKPDKTRLARAMACADDPPLADATLPAS